MTDTTDIKALREQWETLHERLDLDIFITTVLTALEAERQRADELKINWDAAKNSIQFYKAEIAALKGDQVPVGYTNESALEDVACGETSIFGPDRIVGRIPLYDRPQKPVVLPPLSNIHRNWSGEYLDKAKVIEAIEAAGGIVKDGE